MGKRIDMLPLEELYEKAKITPAVAKQIVLKEDFTKISENYCQKVCNLPSRNKQDQYKAHKINDEKVDILIVYPTKSCRDKWKEGTRIDEEHQKIIRQLAKDYFAPYKLKVDVTFSMRCRPDEPKTTVTTIRKCVPYLAQEIAQRRPSVVLGLGVDVGKAMGLPKVPRGIPKSVEALGYTFPLLCTLHPKILTMIRQNASGDFWGPDYLDILRRDFAKAAMIATGKVTLKPIEQAVEEIKPRIHVATTIAEIEKFVEFIEKQPKPTIISWDTETTGLDPWREDARFLCHQFGYRDKDGVSKSLVVPLWHKKNTHYDAKVAWRLLRRLLENETIHKVTHNGAFDMIYTRVTTGVEVKSVLYDTMLLLHSNNSGMQGCYDLKTSTADLLFELQLGGYEDLMSPEEVSEETEDEDEAVP